MKPTRHPENTPASDVFERIVQVADLSKGIVQGLVARGKESRGASTDILGSVRLDTPEQLTAHFKSFKSLTAEQLKLQTEAQERRLSERTKARENGLARGLFGNSIKK